MLMPNKDLTIEESLLGLSFFILKNCKAKRYTVDLLWDLYIRNYHKKGGAYHSFDNFILAIDFLYLINKLNINHKTGVISIEIN